MTDAELPKGIFNDARDQHRTSSRLAERASWFEDENVLAEVEANSQANDVDVEIDLNSHDFDRVLAEGGIDVTEEPVDDRSALLAPARVADNALAEDPSMLTGLTWGESSEDRAIFLGEQRDAFLAEEAALEELWNQAETQPEPTGDNLDQPVLEVISDQETAEDAVAPVPSEQDEKPPVASRASKKRKSFLSRMNPWKQNKEHTATPERTSKRTRNTLIGAVAIAGALVVGTIVGNHLTNGSEVTTVAQPSAPVEEIASAFNNTTPMPEVKTVTTELRLPIPAARTQAEMPKPSLQQIAQNQRDLDDFDRLVADINAGLSNQEILARLDAAVAAEHAQQLNS